MMLAIRSAKESEIDRLIELLAAVNGHVYKSLAEKYVTAMFTECFRKPHFVVALKNGIIIGAVAYSEEIFTTNTWGISWVSVSDFMRNKGIGQKLIEECLRQITRQVETSVTVMLATYPNKTRLYDKLGFQPMGHDHEGGQFMNLIINKSLH